jgi:D-alanyl-D-alanine endopeptidase (penicillin-binding protein 7)
MKWFCLLLLLAVQPSWASADFWLYDQTNKQVVAEQDKGPRPIASLTKVMTAMVYLDANPGLDESMSLSKRLVGYLPRRIYTSQELLTALLVWSDNAAAETLAENYPGGRTAFLAAMNAKAQTLGLTNTYFDDPSGLSRQNVSTAAEVAQMLITAQSYPVIKEISTKKQAEVQINSNRKKSGLLRPNTNFQTLNQISDVVLSKTGYTTPAGFCMGIVIEQSQRIYVLVVLGAKNKLDRLALAKFLVNKNITASV